MQSKRQQDLIDTFLSSVGGSMEPLYREIADCLAGFGYKPQKQKLNISFKHDLHNKQIAKMGNRNTKERPPFFALRFSACEGYSQRFADVVNAAIEKFPNKVAGCLSGKCNYCAGEPHTHVYKGILSDDAGAAHCGAYAAHCGAYALEIPDIAAGDIEEIKKLIKEEHDYLIKYEANRTE